MHPHVSGSNLQTPIGSLPCFTRPQGGARPRTDLTPTNTNIQNKLESGIRYVGLSQQK